MRMAEAKRISHRSGKFLGISRMGEAVFHGKQHCWWQEGGCVLTVIGGKTNSLLRDLLAPEKPQYKSLSVLFQKLKENCKLKQLVIAERFYFHRRDPRCCTTAKGGHSCCWHTLMRLNGSRREHANANGLSQLPLPCGKPERLCQPMLLLLLDKCKLCQLQLSDSRQQHDKTPCWVRCTFMWKKDGHLGCLMISNCTWIADRNSQQREMVWLGKSCSYPSETAKSHGGWVTSGAPR